MHRRIRALRAWLLAATAQFALLGVTAPYCAQAAALHGVALVIGEASYKHLQPLDNPPNDATAIGSLLFNLGFDVTRVANAEASDLEDRLTRFEAAASGADVALVYYSGHGIEAGGEDYLVPVDADVSTPKSAGEKLVPLSSLLEQLRARVPLTIVLLDACRRDVFPAGQLVQLPGAATPIAVGETGLDVVRGPMPIAAAAADSKSVGMVIGFAAAPGAAALDGEPGTNSPYAAALLKHLGAGGFSFGDVMTMVAQEVYLKTRARQLPWTNSSLTEVLDVGTPPAPTDVDEAAILNGRRQLLLTIAAQPDATRHYVEGIASTEDVPLDELYGMLKQLDVKTSGDPTTLEAEFREGAERLKGFLAERQSLQSEDPEVARIARLADEAVDEGALDQAMAFYDAAKARIAVLSKQLASATADISARRLEFAQLYARSAAAHELSFDFIDAALDWEAAYNQAALAGDASALAFKRHQADDLDIAGTQSADADQFAAAIDAYHVALDLTPKATASDDWATTEIGLGQALSDLGAHKSDPVTLNQAAEAINAALSVLNKDRQPEAWARAQVALAGILYNTAYRQSDTSSNVAAAQALRAALAVVDPKATPSLWAKAQTRLAAVLSSLGQRDATTTDFTEAVAAYRAALTILTETSAPLEWAEAQMGLGSTLELKAVRGTGTEDFEQAVAADQAALEVSTRDRAPAVWARLENQVGIALVQWGKRGGDASRLDDGIAALKASLDVTTQETDPLLWASTQNNLANALAMRGERTNSESDLRQAVAAYELALKVQTRQAMPPDYATTNLNLGLAVAALSGFDREQDPRAALADFQAALTVWTRATASLYWANVQTSIGEVEYRIGVATHDAGSLRQASSAFEAALEERTHDRVPLDWAHTEADLGMALAALGAQTGSLGNSAEGLADLRAASEVEASAGDPVGAAFVADQLAWAGKIHGDLSKSVQEIKAARDAEAQAWAAYRSAGIDRDNYFKPRLAAIDADLAAHGVRGQGGGG